MTDFLKTVLSGGVIAFFLLIGWATTFDDGVSDFDFGVGPTFTNISDSCNVANLSFTYKKRRDSFDTLRTTALVRPGQTIQVGLDSAFYDSLFFLCSCPDSSVHQVIMGLNAELRSDQNFELNCN